MAAVRASFKPEFVNRLDEIVVFDALGPDELARVTALQVRRLADRLADRRIVLDVSEEATDWLARTGYDPVYGARPLRRLVQSAIGDPLARLVLAGDVPDGATVRVGVAADGHGLTVTAGRASDVDRPGEAVALPA